MKEFEWMETKKLADEMKDFDFKFGKKNQLSHLQIDQVLFRTRISWKTSLSIRRMIIDGDTLDGATRKFGLVVRQTTHLGLQRFLREIEKIKKEGVEDIDEF